MKGITFEVVVCFRLDFCGPGDVTCDFDLKSQSMVFVFCDGAVLSFRSHHPLIIDERNEDSRG